MKAAVGHISTFGRLRKADPKQVAALAESIKEVGLLNPITVSPEQVIFNGQKIDGYQLVAGLHRLEACKSLGWAEVPIAVVDLDEQRRIIAECDENLMRHLGAAEEAQFLAARQDAYEALYPETKHGHSTKESRQLGDSAPIRFTADTALKTGKSERAIQRATERGTKVCKEALDILKGTKADTGTVLDALKDLPPEQQVLVAYREVQKRQEPKPQPKAPRIADAPESDEAALERQVAALMSAWNKASPDARREFLGRIDSPLMDRRWE